MSVLLLLFQPGFLLFLFLIWLLCLGIPKLCRLIVARVGILSCSWTYRKCLQFFIIKNNICLGFIIYGLYYVEVGSFYAYFWRVFFYHKCILNLLESFFYIYWDNHIIFFFQFVNMVYNIDWFACIEESLHHGHKPDLLMVYDHFNALVIPFARLLLRIFSFMLISELRLWFSFLWCLYLVLVSEWWWTCRMSLEVFLPLQFFGRAWEE